MSFLPKLSNKANSLPLTSPTPADKEAQQQPPIRRRLSSLSLQIPQNGVSQSSFSSTWSNTFRRSKSVSSEMGAKAGNSIKSWWEWGWNWILSRKPSFAKDLEMDQEEKQFIGVQCRGSLKHLFYKVKSELKILRSGNCKNGLPTSFRYTSSNYTKNFDDGSSIRRPATQPYVVMAH